MPLKLIEPGKRKGNRFYLIRGMVNGREREVSTKTTDRRVAEEMLVKFHATLLGSDIADRRETKTFSGAARIYVNARNPSHEDRRLIEKLETILGHRMLMDIRQMHLDEAANVLYRGLTNETKNRKVYGPAAAVLHYAAKNELCPYLVVEKLPEKTPLTRRVTLDNMFTLIDATEGYKQRFLITIYHQGWRITETLKIEWERIYLDIGEVDIWINKSKTWKRIQLHPETIDALSAVPLAERTGRVFPWSHRRSVYNWLTPLTKKLGIEFTPHMARHTFASELGDREASNRDLVKLSTWTHEKSVSRYTDVDKDRQIEVQNRLPVRVPTWSRCISPPTARPAGRWARRARSSPPSTAGRAGRLRRAARGRG